MASTGTGHRSWPGAEHRSTRVPVELELTPLRITLLYLVFGFSALFVSDVLFVRYLSDPLLAQVQALKGGVEVLLTGGLIYGLTRVSWTQLDETNAELDRRREELNVLHRVLRHNLRNDLNVVEGYTERLAARADSDDEAEMCERILATCDEMVRYTEQASRIRKISPQERSPKELDLADHVPRLVADHRRVGDDVDVETDLPQSAPVAVNPMFDRALGELVENAVVHADAGTPSVSIAVGVDDAPPDLTRVEITDDGPGVPDDVEQVFSESPRDQLVHVDGLGLWFVYLTVVASGGEFEIESRDDGGTTVRLWVPTVSDTAGGRPPLAVSGWPSAAAVTTGLGYRDGDPAVAPTRPGIFTGW